MSSHEKWQHIETPKDPNEGLIPFNKLDRLPSYGALIASIVGGVLMIIAFFVIGMRALDHAVNRPYYGCMYTDLSYPDWCQQQQFLEAWHLDNGWVMAAIVVIGTGIGIYIAINANSTLNYVYRDVPQGQVTADSFSSGQYGDSYGLYVRGYNRAGEIVVARHNVSPKTYSRFDAGELIDFRRNE